MTPRDLVDSRPRPERLRNNPRLRLIRPTPTAPAIASANRENLQWSIHGEPPSHPSQEAPIPDHEAGQKVGAEQRLRPCKRIETRCVGEIAIDERKANNRHKFD